MNRLLRGVIKRRKPSETNNSALRLSKSLSANLKMFQEEIFPGDRTIVYRRLLTCGPNELTCALIFVDQMVDRKILAENVVEPLQEISQEYTDIGRAAEFIVDQVIGASDVTLFTDVNDIISGLLVGSALLLIDGFSQGIVINIQGFETRAVQEPSSESVVRGPREGFTEAIFINLALLRRKLRTSELRFEIRDLGVRTKTRIAISYIDGIASPEIIQELYNRLESIDLDSILESGYIEEMIKDSPLTPFKTIGHTERPDIVAGKLLEGRIAVFVDGTPFVLTLPYLFMEAFQANEDYYKNFLIASVDRLLRYIAFFITTSTPAFYMSLITYHQEMIPTQLLLTISAAREGVPFPTVFEVLIMGLIFELLREGGIRLPTPIGQALSIVGAIVLGDAAVTANLISAPMIIVVALTAIASFAIPQLLGVAIIIRLLFVLLSSILGLYGYMFGVMGLFIQLASMRSFGVPYMSNLGSLRPQDIKDTTLRAPWWVMNRRPKLIGNRNLRRRGKQA